MSMEDTKVRTEPEIDDATDAEVVIDAEQVAETEAALDAVLDEARETDGHVTNFTAPLSDIEHGHGLTVEESEGQHDLRARFNVDEDFIGDHMYSMPNDHLALFEMVERRAEFERADDNVFTDVANDNSRRWNNIESFVQSNRAPVPDHARQRLRRIINSN